MYTEIEQDGIHCVVQAHEVEQRSIEGWQLVCVIDADALVPVVDTVAAPMVPGIQVTGTGTSNYGVPYMAPTVMETRTKKVHSPLFLMRRGEDTELGRLAQAVEKATKDAETAKAALKETSKKAQDAEKERSTLESQMKSLRSAFEAEQAAGRKLGDKVEATNATLALREQEIAKLTERLGKGARTTAYERLLTEDLDLAGMPTREETSTP